MDTDFATRPRGTEELRESARHLKHDVRELGAAARHVAQDSLADARQCVAGYAEQGRTQVRDALATVEGKIQERPATALLVAAGVGILLGILVMRRM